MKHFKANRDSGGRNRYILEDDIDGSKLSLTGTTTVLGIVDKPFLIPWAVKEAYKDLVSFMESCKSANDFADKVIEHIAINLKEGTYPHQKKSSQSLDLGSLAHTEVEHFVKHYIANKNYDYKIQSNIEGVKLSVQRFIDWAVKEQVEFFSSEESVYSEIHLIAGTYDFICKIKGEWYIGDFKTSKQVDDSYHPQASAYGFMINERNQQNIKWNTIIFKSMPTDKDIVYYQKGTKYPKKIVQPVCEISIHTSKDYDRDLNYFFACLYIYRYKRNQLIKFWNNSQDVSFEEYQDYVDNLPLFEM